MNLLTYCLSIRLKRIGFLFFFLYGLTPPLIVTAHVGSSGVVVQKQAGAYRLLIRIKPPDVIPGTALITVFVEQGRATHIGARPVYFQSGNKGAPTYDPLTVVSAHQFEGDAWLMTTGSSSIELSIDGPDGHQQVLVPVVAVATALRTMPAGTGWGLAAMGLLLVVMLITILGASTAEGITVSEQSMGKTLYRRRLVGMSVGLLAITLIITGWRSWWMATATDYRNVQLYRPTPVHATVQALHNQQILRIRIDTTGLGANSQKHPRLSYLLPDHGRLMHAFLVRLPGLDAFAHLHPTRRDTLNFEAALPPLPAGTYRLYADIVYRSGFAETLTDTLIVPGTRPTTTAHPSDRDDSWLVAKPMDAKVEAASQPHLDNTMIACGTPGASQQLADGTTMLWMDKPSPILETDKLYLLKFAVADATGKATPLEPYMGMGGHAVILRSDGSVYIHLHPIGTYSMAAEGSLTGRLTDTTRAFQYPNATHFRDSIDAYVARLTNLPEADRNRALQVSMPSMQHGNSSADAKINNMVQFPYAFPRAGHYRIWVQVKHQGRILTGVFDTQVNEPLL